MNPIKSRKSISDSYFKYGVKNFALDSEAELKKILEQTKFAKDLNLHLRISIPNTYARLKIEKKFGVEPSLSDKLLRKLFFYAKKIGICFHVGSQCVSPQAYRIGLKISKRLIEKATYKIDYLNVGGGFPVVYSPRKKNILNNYFSVINEEFSKIKNYQKISLLSEPGRCLVADCLSLIVRVELRKSQKLYINEGVHGFLYSAGTNNFSYVVKMINKKRKKINKYLPFSFYGPTCDANDFMKGPFILPDSIEEGDYIEIFQMGAYSQTFQTDFNGFGYSGEINIINYNDLKKVKI